MPIAGVRAIRTCITAATAAAVTALVVLPVAAAPITFDFNSIVLSGNQGNGLGGTANSTSIGTYLTTALGTTVTASGALATKTYNGENHVNGSTLGTSDGGVAHTVSTQHPDVFIINDNFGVYGGASSSFTLSFGQGFFLTSIAFDWEIFPDATCASGSTCAGSNGSNANWPDISLMVNGNSTAIWSAKATVPGSSPNDPQRLGTLGTLDLTSYGAVTSITIHDWPAEVGIDNLTITGGCIRDSSPLCKPRQQNLPEPGSMLLLGIALAALGIATRRRTMHGATI